MKQTGTLRNYSRLGNCLVGKIEDHPRQKSFLKDRQITSPVIRYFEDDGKKYAETVNTIYLLLEPRYTS